MKTVLTISDMNISFLYVKLMNNDALNVLDTRSQCEHFDWNNFSSSVLFIVTINI